GDQRHRIISAQRGGQLLARLTRSVNNDAYAVFRPTVHCHQDASHNHARCNHADQENHAENRKDRHREVRIKNQVQHHTRSAQNTGQNGGRFHPANLERIQTEIRQTKQK
ncbi:hypothetical protein CGU37_29505, partial [Pseudomonas fluorescens]